MTEEHYRQAEEGLDAVLGLFREHDAELRVSEIRIKASLEAVRAELLKLALRAREESSAPFRVIEMDATIESAGRSR